MPTLILENVPNLIYENLKRRAVAGQRSVPDETVYLLRQVLEVEERTLPDASEQHFTSADDAEDTEVDRPWRGVFVPPRPRDTLFVQTTDVPVFSLPKRSLTLNMGWHRTEPSDA